MILFYVSGHGFGHATRTRAVIDALHALHPGLPIQVRTAAPEFLFGPNLRYWQVAIDPPVIESADALHIDSLRTAAAVDDYLAAMPQLVQREGEFVRATNVQLIVADIPFVAGLIAQAANVPAIAIGNFTWDWILEPVGTAAIRQAYSCFNLALRLPLCQREGWDIFPEWRDVPLLTPRSQRPREEIRAELGIENLRQPVVLIAGRASLDSNAFDALRRSCPDYRFLCNQDLPCFHDLIRAADVVVSKIGYTTAAECIAEGRALLFPPRSGFREEQILSSEAPNYMRALPISVEDWRSGNWRTGLETLLALRHPESTLPCDGDMVCASEILARRYR